MGGDQLPDGFNLGTTDIAPAITELRLHDRQHRRFNLERKPLVELFFRAKPSCNQHVRYSKGWAQDSSPKQGHHLNPDISQHYSCCLINTLL